jgi:hypothetical protein
MDDFLQISESIRTAALDVRQFLRKSNKDEFVLRVEFAEDHRSRQRAGARVDALTPAFAAIASKTDGEREEFADKVVVCGPSKSPSLHRLTC